MLLSLFKSPYKSFCKKITRALKDNNDYVLFKIQLDLIDFIYKNPDKRDIGRYEELLLELNEL